VKIEYHEYRRPGDNKTIFLIDTPGINLEEHRPPAVFARKLEEYLKATLVYPLFLVLPGLIP
jgi:hypothetical protein